MQTSQGKHCEIEVLISRACIVPHRADLQVHSVYLKNRKPGNASLTLPTLLRTLRHAQTPHAFGVFCHFFLFCFGCRDAMVCVSALFDQVHQACTQLDELADRRLSILNQRLQLAVFEEQTASVSICHIVTVSTKGHVLICKENKFLLILLI